MFDSFAEITICTILDNKDGRQIDKNARPRQEVKKSLEDMLRITTLIVFLALLSACVLFSYHAFFKEKCFASTSLDPSTQPETLTTICPNEKFWKQDSTNGSPCSIEDSCDDEKRSDLQVNALSLSEERGDWVKYTDPTRGVVGSQSEEPWWEVQQDDSLIMVDGYHKFIASRALNGTGLASLQIMKNPDKFRTVSSILFGLIVELRARFGYENRSISFMDIGCSGGIVSLLAHRCGFDRVLSLDHDAGYIELVHGVVEHLHLRSAITPLVFQFGQELRGNMQKPLAVNRDAEVSLPKIITDVVYCGAMIHWVFSSTALFGNFWYIFEYLFSLSSALVVVEWVAPEDPAITRFGQTSMNIDVHSEAYSLENFEGAIVRFGGVVLETIVIDGPTRILYVIKKPITVLVGDDSH